MPAPGPAVATDAANNVTFTGHALADTEFGGCRTGLHDLAAELVADDHRHRNGSGRPLVPFPDMHVGATDRGLPDLDQHVARPRFGHRDALHPKPLTRLGLDQGLHFVAHPITPSSRPVSTKAAMAWSSSSSVCAADICVRMRSWPFGTTGKLKGAT